MLQRCYHLHPLSRQDDAGTKWFGQYQLIPLPYPGIGDNPAGMHRANHCQPVFRRPIIDGMPSDDADAGLACLVKASSQNVFVNLHRNPG